MDPLPPMSTTTAGQQGPHCKHATVGEKCRQKHSIILDRLEMRKQKKINF